MTRSSLAKLLAVFVLTLFALLIMTAVTMAQDAGAVPGPTGAASANEVNDVAKELWCPLCSGVRLDACELRACDQMKDVIAEKLGAGESVQNIKNYFVQQYGPQVLGEPPMEGFNWLAWLLPIVAVVAGGYFVWTRTRKMVRPSGAPAAADLPDAPGEDRYSQELEKELKQYD